MKTSDPEPRTLATEIRIGGFTHRQIQREYDIAIYEQRKGDRVYAWEVIVVQSHDGRVIDGKAIPPAEYYPSATQWGSYGWTCPTKDRALETAAELAARAPVRSRALKRGRYKDREEALEAA